jgi:hypothetical protein
MTAVREKSDSTITTKSMKSKQGRISEVAAIHIRIHLKVNEENQNLC